MTDRIKKATSHMKEARIQILNAQSEVTKLLEEKDMSNEAIFALHHTNIQCTLAFERMGSAISGLCRAEKVMESDSNG